MKSPIRTATRPAARAPILSSGRGGLFSRTLDRDVVVSSDRWLIDSGVQQQLEFEGYRLRWVSAEKVNENLEDGWLFATLSYYLWWRRRIRRRHRGRNQYLLMRTRSFRETY